MTSPLGVGIGASQPRYLTDGFGNPRSTANVFKTFSIAASANETTIWTPASGKRFRLMGFALFSDTGTALTFRDDTAGTTIWSDGVAAGGRANSPDMGDGILSAAADNVLTLQCATAATVNGTVFGTEE